MPGDSVAVAGMPVGMTGTRVAVCAASGEAKAAVTHSTARRDNARIEVRENGGVKIRKLRRREFATTQLL